MATYVKFVKPGDAEILLHYLDDEGVTLIFPDAQKAVEEAGVSDGDLVEYDFGGDCDVWVDLVCDEDHLFVQHIKENQDEG